MTDQTPTPPIIPPSGGNSIWSRWWMIVIYVVLGIGVGAALFGGDSTTGDETAAPTTTVEGATTTTIEDTTTTTAGPTTTTTTLPPTTTTTNPPTTTTTLPIISEGVYIVPDELGLGTYRFVGYMARLDENLEIIDNDLGDGQLIVIVRESDFALQITGTIEPLP